MTSVSVLTTSAAIELLFEGFVDALALDIEFRNGVDLDLFWGMWKRNAPAFWGVTVTNSFISIMGSIWASKQVPTFAFCKSPIDVCSCSGGGFELFESFCNVTATRKNWNKTSVDNKTSIASLAAAAQAEYQGIFDALGVDAVIIVISIGIGFLIVVVFIVARMTLALLRANNDKAEAERRAAELREANIKIQDQLMLTQLNKEQVAVVEANSEDLKNQIPAELELDWRGLVFEGHLGSGSFGDCYKGRSVYHCSAESTLKYVCSKEAHHMHK